MEMIEVKITLHGGLKATQKYLKELKKMWDKDDFYHFDESEQVPSSLFWIDIV